MNARVIMSMKPVEERGEELEVTTDLLDNSHIYVHCHIENSADEVFIRIWSTTFLIDRSSGTRSSLVHAENISMAPRWTFVKSNSYTFLLIFSGLPRSCSQFDFVEEISQPGGFFVEGIQRNKQDVYHINLM